MASEDASILAMALAALLLYRLTGAARRSGSGLDRDSHFHSDAGRRASSLRGSALFLSIAVVLASILYFWRWLDKRCRLDGALCIVFLAAAFYSHPTSGLMAFVYALLIAREALSERALAWKQIALGAAELGVLCFPILPYYRSAAGRASTFSFVATPGLIFDFFAGIAASGVSAASAKAWPI